MERRVPNTVDVAVSMSPRFLKMINKHLERVGVNNRSGWIRAAIMVYMTNEIEALREPDETVY